MIDLTEQERDKFVAWLDEQAEQDDRLVAFLAEMPDGSNGAKIRARCTADALAARRLIHNLNVIVYADG